MNEGYRATTETSHRKTPQGGSGTAGSRHDGEQQAYSALAELLSRADLHRSTGRSTLTIEFNQGGVRAVKIGTEEIYKPS